jgi:hypothetical protein
MSPPPRQAVQIPGAVTESTLLVPIVTWSVVSNTGTPTVEPTAPINLTGWEYSAVSGSTSASPHTDATDVPSHTSDGLDIEGDSSADEGVRFLPDGTVEESQGIPDIAWIPFVPGVTVTLRQQRVIVTWTAFQHDATAEHDPYADTTAVRASQVEVHVGLNEGLHVTDGQVDVSKLWLRLYPGDMHADLQKFDNLCLSKRVDFVQASPQEYVWLWGLIVAKAVHSNMDGIRDQPQFQKYMAFQCLGLFFL